MSLRLDDVSNRLKNRRITLDVDQTAREWLAKQGYSDVYGARAIARVVRTDVLFPLAQKLLKGTIRSTFFSLIPRLLYTHVDENRDGDVVKIRVSGDVLDIQENHQPDPTIVRPSIDIEEKKNP